MNWLANNHPESVAKNIEYIAEYGRYDDLLCLFGTECENAAIEFIAKQLSTDIKAMYNNEEVSLLAKWLPSINASNSCTVANAKTIAKALGLKDSVYRKTLSELRKYIRIIENNLREKTYSFDYEKQPSKALFKYRKAFVRNDKERYESFLDAVSKGQAKLNARNVMPYEIVQPFLREGGWYSRTTGFMKEITEEEKASLNATWNALPNYCSDENVLAVIDTSGSMYFQNKPLPAAVALSLGLYFAERNKGVFSNHFIEFSNRPQLIEIKGETFADKLQYISTFNEVANTNLEAVFDLILNTAVKNRVTQAELPAKIIIISDMEFNGCMEGASVTNFENAKAKFAHYGYKLPQVVFWNVASRNRHQPVKMNEQGVALISGANPRIFSMVAGGLVSPYTMMLEILESERYAKIAA